MQTTMRLRPRIRKLSLLLIVGAVAPDFEGGVWTGMENLYYRRPAPLV